MFLACQKRLPNEILLKILDNCDYKSLKSARNVNLEWMQLIDYIIEKRCSAEISPEKYLQISDKWTGSFDINLLYDNWKSWRNLEIIDIKTETIIQNDNSDNNSISSMSVKGGYMIFAKGNEITLYNTNKSLIKKLTLESVTAIDAVHLISPDYDRYPTNLIVVCLEISNIYLLDLSGTHVNCSFECDYGFAAYKEYFCGMKDGLLKVAKVDSQVNKYTVLRTVEIDTTADSLVSVTLTSHRVIILDRNIVKVLEYDYETPKLITLAQLQNTVDYERILGEFHTWIFQDEIVIVLYWGLRSDDQVLDIYILDKGPNDKLKPVQSLKPFDLFEDEINYVWFHANTLMLILMHGLIVFYDVPIWGKLDFRYYNKSMIVDNLTPIVEVNLEESYHKRVFFIAGRSRIESIVCRTNVEEI